MSNRKGIPVEQTIKPALPVAPVVPKPAKPQKTPEQFVEAYEALCKEWGYRIMGHVVSDPMNIGHSQGMFISVEHGVVLYNPPEQEDK